MTVIVDKRYAETKERRAQSDLRDVRAQFTSAHGAQQGERLLTMLTGSGDAGSKEPRPAGDSAGNRQRRR
ncbi:hypothetical protein [Methylorubrum extorquens]|uniref:hypothetical protein n=1 Tax=Methylorubrum extorquens TaxID=408 RepID=UPI0005A4FA87|nr:hypothetical protein [Methylorubrum extorquens]